MNVPINPIVKKLLKDKKFVKNLMSKNPKDIKIGKSTYEIIIM